MNLLKSLPSLFLLKAHVKQHTRRTKSGKVVVVKEHTDSRTKKTPARNEAADARKRADEMERQRSERHKQRDQAKATATSKVKEGNAKKKEGDALDPNAKNYRYQDRGYVPGSRKEQAAAVAEFFRLAAKDGTGVRHTTVNWDALEDNPRAAAKAVVKEAVLAEVDWDALEKKKVEPGAAFLMQKMLAAVAPTAEDSPEKRRDYVYGCNMLQDRMAKCKTVKDVVDEIDKIREEMTGFTLDAAQAKEYKKLTAAKVKARDEYSRLEKESRDSHNVYYHAEGRLSGLKWEQDKRTRRGWKPDAELQGRIDALSKEVEAGRKAHTEWQEKNGKKHAQAEGAWRDSWKAVDEFENVVRAKNLIQHPLTKGFRSLGGKFYALVNYRSTRTGSDAFGKHVATAKAGRIKDYSFAREEKKARAASKESQRFQFAVADQVERIGGRPLASADYGTDDLKKQFRLANVQSGNWVLKDVNSAKSHVEQCALAFQDLADITGIPEKDISLNGRLSMAFGARGHGLSGAAAHYEPVHRVINLTKMKGGGSLAHEWLHSVDDIVGEIEAGKRAGRETYATSETEPKTEVQKAFANLVEVMTAGDHTVKTTKTITESEAEHWKKVMERNKRTGFYGASGLKAIHDAPDISAAIESLHKMFTAGRFGAIGQDGKAGAKASRNYENHKQAAVAWHAGTSATYDVPGFRGSKYLVEAQKLSAVHGAGYFDSRKEMAARAFAAYMEDKLEEAKRRNTYLTAHANNEHPAYKMFGWKPYPEGAERKKINKVFDALFKVLKKEKTLKKAAEFLEGEEMRKALCDPRIAKFLLLKSRIRTYVKKDGTVVREHDDSRHERKLQGLIDDKGREARHHILRTVTREEAARIREATGLDVEGYRHAVTNTSIRHILKQHGNQAAEDAAGQIAITAKDILLIPKIISRPDSIERGTDTTRGDKTIVYVKKFKDGTTRYVAEVIGAGKVLHTKTMYKKKN